MNASCAVAPDWGMHTPAGLVARLPHAIGTALEYVEHVDVPTCCSHVANCWNVAVVPCAAQHALHDCCRHAIAAEYAPPQPLAVVFPIALAMHPAMLTVQYASFSCHTIAAAVASVSCDCRHVAQLALACTNAPHVCDEMGGVRHAA